MMWLEVSRRRSSLSLRFDMREVLSLLVVGLCATMLAVGRAEGVYLPVLAGVVGYWMPCPFDSAHGPFSTHAEGTTTTASAAAERAVESVGSVAAAVGRADDSDVVEIHAEEVDGGVLARVKAPQ